MHEQRKLNKLKLLDKSLKIKVSSFKTNGINIDTVLKRWVTMFPIRLEPYHSTVPHISHWTWLLVWKLKLTIFTLTMLNERSHVIKASHAAQQTMHKSFNDNFRNIRTIHKILLTLKPPNTLWLHAMWPSILGPGSLRVKHKNNSRITL